MGGRPAGDDATAYELCQDDVGNLFDLNENEQLTGLAKLIEDGEGESFGVCLKPLSPQKL